jgi:site-specific DNA recombinase
MTMSNEQTQPLRAALYARYSTDRQRETSIDDQLRAARARAEQEGWPIVAEHADPEISGSVPVALRRGGKALIADALAARFDVLIIEGLDRVVRDLGEQEQLVKRLEFRGIRIIGTGDGYDSQARGRKVMRVARGLVNELYLDDLREKTHRGLAGQFDRGYHVGGVCYGYRSEDTPDGRGRRLVVDEEQANTVRRIFREYGEGASARSIVHRLNAEGIASPRGGTWAVSALVGDRKRGAGLLNSEIYVGRLVWNRRQWLKDPETGKRRYVDRPQSEWQVREVPELRIVDAEAWAVARARDLRPERTRAGAPLRTLFAGLLRCSVCGGPMTAIDARRYGCHARNDRGASVCAGGGAFPRGLVDQALLAVVREELLAPSVLASFQAAVTATLRAAMAERSSRGAGANARRSALQAEISRLVDAVAQVGMSEALKQRLQAAEGELASLGKGDDSSPAIDAQAAAKQALAAYKRRMLDLQAALQQDTMDRDRTRGLLAEMLGPVVLRRDQEGDWAEMEEPAQRVALAGSTPLMMVARARNVHRKLIRRS